jgi:DNA cross-link repair 1A protein
LFFCGSYSIGKEKIALAIAEALDLRIYADKRKRNILEQLDFGTRISSRMASQPGAARVHIIPMSSLSPDGLKAYSKRAGLNTTFIGTGLAVVLKPTGWSFRPGSVGGGGVRRSSRSVDQAILYDVAYSEHSSFAELQDFVRWAKPFRIFPTVNVKTSSDADRLRNLLGHQDRPMRVVPPSSLSKM